MSSIPHQQWRRVVRRTRYNIIKCGTYYQVWEAKGTVSIVRHRCKALLVGVSGDGAIINTAMHMTRRQSTVFVITVNRSLCDACNVLYRGRARPVLESATVTHVMLLSSIRSTQYHLISGRRCALFLKRQHSTSTEFAEIIVSFGCFRALSFELVRSVTLELVGGWWVNCLYI